MSQLSRIGRPFGKFRFGCLQIGDVDECPIDYGSPGDPVTVYRPYRPYRPLS
jgi:hypothetical protein